jgi:trans-aconitate methyltransferase
MNCLSPTVGTDCAERPGDRCEFASIGEFPDISSKVGRLEVLRCRWCGHGITMPPLENVAFLYAGRESQDYQPDAKGLSAAIKDVAFRLQARRLLRQLPKTPTTVLDFGCGSGQFTRVLGEQLPQAVVVGSDFHDTPPAGLGGLPYKPMSELDGKAGVGCYDLVLAMHVLEHDDDTAGLLSRIAGFAKPGGTVVIEVPHVDCIWNRLLGKKWDAWYVPYHRTHFTRASLRHKVEAAGLRVIAMHEVTVPTMGRTLANVFGGKNGLLWLLVGIALHPFQWAGERLTRRPSAVRVIARV